MNYRIYWISGTKLLITAVAAIKRVVALKRLKELSNFALISMLMIDRQSKYELVRK